MTSWQFFQNVHGWYLHRWWNCWGIQPHLCRYLAFRRNSSRSISGSGDWMRRDLVQYFSNYPPELLCFVIPNILIPTIHCWVFYGIHSAHTPRIKEALSWQDPVQSPVCHEWSWHLSIECGVYCRWREEFVLQFQEIEISTLHTTELFRKLWKW